MKSSSIFIISLDFELHWGGFEKWDPIELKDYFIKTREIVIPGILELFKKYKIHSTWATVGMLIHQDREELESSIPSLKPTYELEYLSAYKYILNNGIGVNEKEDPLHYGSSLLRLITSTQNQEIATHTYAHYFCNESGQTTEQFRADLRAATHASSKFGVNYRSLVFPRNQFNENYLKVCAEEGIKVARTNPSDWFWNIDSTQNESSWLRLNRGMDAYFPTGDKKTFKLKNLNESVGVLLLPASRLLRPWSPKFKILNKLRIDRVKSEMKQAAKDGEIYHLWWHPHNFGWYPEENLRDLEIILEYFVEMKEKYGMESLGMGDIYDRWKGLTTKNGEIGKDRKDE